MKFSHFFDGAKGFLSLQGAILIAALMPAMAQNPVYQLPPLVVLTNQVVAGGSTSNYTAVIDGRYSEILPLELLSTSAGTNVNNYTITVQKSLDSSNWDITTPHMTWVLVGNGANVMRHLTNMPTLGYGYFRISAVANANPDTSLTILSVRYVPMIRP